MHADDVLDARGRPPVLSDDAADVCLGVAAWLLPFVAAGAPEHPDGPRTVAAEGRRSRVVLTYDPAAGWRTAPPDAAADLVVAGDDDVLVRWLFGRVPVEARGLAVSGDAAEAAAVKRWLPGP